VFSKVTIHQENGKSFVVDAPKASRDAKYVASAMIGGSPLVGTVIPHAAVVSGETLRLEMTAE
jgi:putative alpha-1,2-mannosidase